MEIRYRNDGTIAGYEHARKILLPLIKNDIPHLTKCFYKLRTRRIIEDTIIASLKTDDKIDWQIKLPAIFKINLPYYLKYGMTKTEYEALLYVVD